MTDFPKVVVETPFGPLVATIFAGPTSVPGTVYANDHRHPSKGHAFGREPDPPTVGARVHHALNSGLTIYGVEYKVDASFVLSAERLGNRPAGWQEEFGGWPPLQRPGAPFGQDGPTPKAREAWRETVVPLVVAALTSASAEVGLAMAAARASLVADARERVEELRTEADRLEAMISTEKKEEQS